MRKLRDTPLALTGGTLLVALSVSVAFGGAPTSTDENRGRSIAAFVHELVFGSDETPEEVVDEGAGGLERVGEDGEAAGAHGECVSAVARDKEAVGGPNENHGGAVSEAAREACREDEDPAPEDDPEEPGAHGECVSAVARDKEAVGGPNENHGGAVSEAAREACREDGDEAADASDQGAEAELSAREQREAEQAAARAAREAARSERKADGADGDGPGGGRP